MSDVDNGIMETVAAGMDDIETSTMEEDQGTQSIRRYIQGKYSKAKEYRETDEIRWLASYRNYRGLYGQDVQFTESEKSRVFIKVTKTKTLAAYGQIIDVLFAGQKFPLSIEPTVLPEGVTESVTFDPQKPDQIEEKEDSPYGFPDDGNVLEPGSTENSLKLGPLEDKLKDIEVKEGVGGTPTSATFNPSMVAAKKMEKLIMDQLEESSASKHLRSSAFEMALFGKCVIKGPFAVNN